MLIPLPKLKAIILYFCQYTDPRFLGKVKLMKLFYFLDFIHVKKYGAPITYDTYVNLEHGPIPSVIKNLVDNVETDLDSATLSDTISIQKRENEDTHRIIALRKLGESDLKLLSQTELEVLKKVCQRFSNANKQTIEEASHAESTWKNTNFLDQIPYSLAAQDADCLVTAEEIELMTKI